MCKQAFSILVVMLFSIALSGCSADVTAAMPDSKSSPAGSSKLSQSSNYSWLWGYYEISFDQVSRKFHVVPARSPSFTLNVVKFLNNDPTGISLTLNGIQNAGGSYEIDVDITLKHPLNTPGFDGYDVRGAFIANGSSSLSTGGLNYPADGFDQTLNNADSHTRWFNPTEFFTQGVFGYTDGDLASPGYLGSSTLSPCKYFGEGLSATSDLWTYLTSVDPDTGTFLPGTSNTRNYQLSFPTPAPGIKFNYAVVANWKGPGPGAHPSHAPETVALDVTVTPDIYYVDSGNNGGDLILDVSIFNWADSISDAVESIIVESSVLSTPSTFLLNGLTPTGGGDHFLTYHLEIPADNITGTDGNFFWVILRQAAETYAAPNGVPNSASGPLTSYFHNDLFVANQPYTIPLPGDVPIQITEIVGGFTRPINVANAGDGSDRLFVVEQAGRLRIVDGGILLPTPYLDITSIVNDAGNEQGLLDVAFHPDYANNGFFFVNYTTGSGSGSTVIERYTVSPGDPDIANPASAKLILQFNQPFSNHNGGKLQFGDDGYLYIATGDGGSGGDPQGNSQNLETFLGKMLRLDIDVDPAPYAIPPDNPFIDDPNAFDEIWAYGLRNPWEFSFDSTNGDMYIADVGQNAWEEIDFQPGNSTGGENYEWNIREGAHCYPSPPCDPPGVGPVAEYDHGSGCSVTGFGVYRGSIYPEIDGIYFYGDYCTGIVWGIARDAQDNWVEAQLLDTSLWFSGAGEGEDGELYVTTFTPSHSLWRLEVA